ncbi:DUF6525 family protein [Pseudooceanicola sp. 200-1SW]|uniref:DUF6525 family protein n=1 Tax=Pseudooceanicola sp. 200-1SW TaxID=3425949 RepID=UPI003D7FC310
MGGGVIRAARGANLRSALPRRRRGGDPMAEFDRLPAPLRGWLAGAALPWSARSARRLYQRALREVGGDETAALARLSAAEHRQLHRDAPRIWGGTGAGIPPRAAPESLFP